MKYGHFVISSWDCQQARLRTAQTRYMAALIYLREFNLEAKAQLHQTTCLAQANS